MFMQAVLNLKIYVCSLSIQPSSQCQGCFIGADTLSAFKARFSKPAASLAAKSRKCCTQGIDVFVGEIHL